MIKILLIDDDESIRISIGATLQLYGYSTILAENGKEGIEKALREKPDIILCDITMPVLDGFGVLKILIRHPETFSIPFIFFTGHSDLADLRRAMALGADDYLIKPINQADLINSIETRFKKSKGLKRNIEPEKIDIKSLLQDSGDPFEYNLTSTKRDIHTYKRKHLLFSQDEKPFYVYLVLDGLLKEFWISHEGKEMITDLYRKGDFVGISPIIEDRKYLENVEVLEDARLMLIPKEDFVEILKKDQVTSNQFVVYLSNNLTAKKNKLVNTAYSSLRKKVAKGLLDLKEKLCCMGIEPCAISISRDDLANYIGVAPESMIRTLKEFKEEGLIEIINNAIFIRKETKLKNLLF